MEPTTGFAGELKDFAEREGAKEARRRHHEMQAEGAMRADQPMCAEAGPYRGPSSRDLLLQRAHHLRVKASQLEALADQLPNRMTPEAAQGLIQLLIR